MRTITVILLVILFCIWQIAFLKKVKCTWKKYIPTAIGGVGVIIGLAICFISYIPYVAKMYSQSTLSENQYFATRINSLSIGFCLICQIGKEDDFPISPKDGIAKPAENFEKMSEDII